MRSIEYMSISLTAPTTNTHMIYRVDGRQEEMTEASLQDALYQITSDMTNKHNVYLDTERQLYFITIATNRMLVVEGRVPINRTIIDLYAITESPVTRADPFGLTFTLKADTTKVYNLFDVLAIQRYTKSSVRKLSDLFMYKLSINAEAVFTTPLYLLAQPSISLHFGPYRLPGATTNTNPTIYSVGQSSDYSAKTLVPWSRIVTQRGDPNDIQAVLNQPNDPTDPYNRGLISVRRPGVYLITGFLQLKSVTSQQDGMEVNIRVNKDPNTYRLPSLCSCLKI